jgi:hypothetical protein
MRTAAENAVKLFQDWVVGIDYRKDVYRAMKAFAGTHPKLSGEDKKLFDETMRDYRRAVWICLTRNARGSKSCASNWRS